jgi:hypothetical protein
LRKINTELRGGLRMVNTGLRTGRASLKEKGSIGLRMNGDMTNGDLMTKGDLRLSGDLRRNGGLMRNGGLRKERREKRGLRIERKGLRSGDLMMRKGDLTERRGSRPLKRSEGTTVTGEILCLSFPLRSYG